MRPTLTLDPMIFDQPWLQSAMALAGLVLLAAIANWIAKRIVLKLARKLLAISPLAEDGAALGSIIRRLSTIVPAIVIQFGIGAVPHLPVFVVTLTRNLAAAFIILMLALAIAGVLGVVNDLYQRRPDARSRP